MKGGIFRSVTDPRETEHETFLNFIQKCTICKIISHTSISAIVYLFDGYPAGETSPYKSFRGGTTVDIRSLIVKLGNINLNLNFKATKHRRNFKPPEVQTVKTFEDEVTNQTRIYRESLFCSESTFEPVCPAIIHSNKQLTQRDIEIFKRCFAKIKTPPFSQAFNAWYDLRTPIDNKKEDLFIIVMEMLEGYDTLFNILTTKNPPDKQRKRFRNFVGMAYYELLRLKKNGICHVDSHSSNIMINQDYPYFTNDKQNQYYGRAMIIDFGRVDRQAPVAAYGKFVPHRFCTTFSIDSELGKYRLGVVRLEHTAYEKQESYTKLTQMRLLMNAQLLDKIGVGDLQLQYFDHLS